MGEISTGESYDVLLGKVKSMEMSDSQGFERYKNEIAGCAILFAITASLLYVLKPDFVCKKRLSHSSESVVCPSKIISFAFFITLVGCIIIVTYTKYGSHNNLVAG